METANHECYVSLEIANLLKEAGFNWACRGYFDDTEFHPNGSVECTNYNSSTCKYLKVPVLEVAQKWLREIKGIFICTTPEIKDYQATWNFYICDEQGLFYENEDCFLTYEEAQEIGIKKALELILEKKE